MMLAAAMAATVLVCPSPSNVFTVPAQHENKSVVISITFSLVFTRAGNNGNEFQNRALLGALSVKSAGARQQQ